MASILQPSRQLQLQQAVLQSFGCHSTDDGHVGNVPHEDLIMFTALDSPPSVEQTATTNLNVDATRHSNEGLPQTRDRLVGPAVGGLNAIQRGVTGRLFGRC